MGQLAILTCRYWILYTTRYLDFVLEHLECFLWRACTLIDVHRPSFGARHGKLSLQHATKIKSLPKHPTYDAVFDIKYMKLFDARPNVFRSFGLHMKQFLTASNIDFSGILETPSYFVSPPWCVVTKYSAGSGASKEGSQICIYL